MNLVGFSRRKKLMVLALAYGMALALLPWLFYQHWGTNDDATMASIADGSVYGTSSEQLIFVHVGMGLVLRTLYSVFPDISWYFAMHVTILVAAFSAIAAVIANRRDLTKPVRLGILLAIWLVAGMPFMLSLQFTQTAFVAAGAGASIWLGMRTSWLSLGAGAAFWVLAYLVRDTTFQAAIILVIPFLIAAAFRNGAKWLGQVMLILCGIFIVGGVTELLYFHGDSERAEFVEFNVARGKLHATPAGWQLPRDPVLLEEVGWSSNDALMFQSWFIMDESVFTTESLNNIVDMRFDFRVPERRPLVDAFGYSLAGSFLALVGLGLVVLVLTNASRGLTVGLAGVGCWYGTMQFLSETARVPARVFYPTLLILALCLVTVDLAGSRTSPPSGRQRWLGLGIGLALIPLAAVGVDDARTVGQEFEQGNVVMRQVRNDLAQLPEEIIVYGWPGTMGKRYQSPSASSSTLGFNLVPFGWSVRSPQWEANLDALGVQSMVEEIATNADMVVLVYESSRTTPRIEKFLLEHYGLAGHLRPKLRLTTNADLVLYDLLVDAHFEGPDVLVGNEGGQPISRDVVPVRTNCGIRAARTGVVVFEGSVTVTNGDEAKHVYVFVGGVMRSVVLTKDGGLDPLGETRTFEFSVLAAGAGDVSAVIIMDENRVGVTKCE